MPSHAAANPAIKQLYINGHFCYVFKFGVITNSLGIVRDITFYNKVFLDAHPDILVEKKSDSPDEDKSLSDAKALIPVLKDFFAKHPLIIQRPFLATLPLIPSISTRLCYPGIPFGPGRRFQSAYIPLNRARLENRDYTINEVGIPCCPNDSNLPMKPESNTSHLRCKLPTFKFVCPKMRGKQFGGKSKRVCLCENPCTASSCGRMVYVHPEKDLRAYPGVIRGTQEWENTYKIRVVVEKGINHFKNSFCIDGRKTRDDKTLHADLLLAGITQLFSVILADKIHRPKLIRSLKPLVA